MPVTLRDIAKRLNLSHATVSFVLNDRRDVAIPESTRQRVMETAREMGYRPNRAARALVSGRTNVLALWLPSLHMPHFARLFESLHTISLEHGYETMYCKASTEPGSKNPFEWPVDGVISVDTLSLLAQRESAPNLPIVGVGAYVDPNFDHVKVDLVPGTEEAIRHLIERGCRRVAHLTTHRAVSAPDGRLEAYERTMRESGLDPEVILCADGDRATIRGCVEEYVRTNGKPDGIFCYSDSAALATHRAMADIGLRAPDDYLLVGFDGLDELEYTVPSISTVRQPMIDGARRAVELMINRLRTPGADPQSVVLPTHLIVRESSTPR